MGYPSIQSRPTIGVSWGLAIAGAIVLLWGGSLLGLLSLDLGPVSESAIALAVLVRTFLHTGLFITTHEAIHGTIAPGLPWLNQGIGRTAARLYALLPYHTLAENHRLHHAHPASDRDPDFHPPGQGFWRWYFQFMRHYLQGSQAWVLIIGMSAIFYGALILGVSLENLLLFWVLPIWFSSLQLFYFGIFQPHRLPAEGYDNRHRAQSSNLPPLLSFFACYHFDYHWEHHEYPQLPWYRLPLAKSNG